MESARFLLVVGLAGIYLEILDAEAAEVRPVYPGKSWETRKPE